MPRPASIRALVLALALLTARSAASWPSERGPSLTSKRPKIRPAMRGRPSVSNSSPMRSVKRIVSGSMVLPTDCWVHSVRTERYTGLRPGARSPRGSVPCRGRELEIGQEEGGELRAPAQARLAIDRYRVLSHRAFAPPGRGGDLLVAMPLEQQEGHLALGGGEAPATELLVDRDAQTLERVAGARLPGVALGHPLGKRAAERGGRAGGAQPAPPEPDRGRQCSGDEGDFIQHVGREPARRRIEHEVDGTPDHDRPEPHAARHPHPEQLVFF